MIHINILNLYLSFGQVWTTTPQEIWSDHQKGKMVKLRVLTEKGQFLIFNLTNDQLGSSMVSRTQWNHLDLITSSKDLKCIGLTDEFSSQLIKNQMYTEKSNFDFLVKIKCQGSFFIKMCQNMKLVHQETQFCKLGFKIEKFHNLEFF